MYNACSSFKACFFPAGTPADETHLLYILLYFLYVVVFIVVLLFASSNVSLSLCIPILLGMIKGLMFSSSRGVSVSSRALSFRFVVWFVVFLAVVRLLVLQNLQVVLQNLVEIESFLTMMMMMLHLVERLVLVLVTLVVELQGVVVVELHPR